jgi:hypothetical protein
MFREMDDDYRRGVPLCTCRRSSSLCEPGRPAPRRVPQLPIRPVDVSQWFVIRRRLASQGALSAWILT